jgi:predicted dehydrogenase
LHFPIAEAALRAGKHVLCEKPLATSSSEARKLVALAQENKLRNCTCHNLRYYPMVQQMRRMREDGDLGEILVVQERIRRTGSSTTQIGTGESNPAQTALPA